MRSHTQGTMSGADPLALEPASAHDAQLHMHALPLPAKRAQKGRTAAPGGHPIHCDHKQPPWSHNFNNSIQISCHPFKDLVVCQPVPSLLHTCMRACMQHMVHVCSTHGRERKRAITVIGTIHSWDMLVKGMRMNNEGSRCRNRKEELE